MLPQRAAVALMIVVVISNMNDDFFAAAESESSAPAASSASRTIPSKPFSSPNSRRRRFSASHNTDPRGLRHSVRSASAVLSETEGAVKSTVVEGDKVHDVAPKTKEPTPPSAASSATSAAGGSTASQKTTAATYQVPPTFGTHGRRTKKASATASSRDVKRDAVTLNKAKSTSSASVQENNNDEGEDNHRASHNWNALRKAEHEAEAWSGAKPIHEMSDEEIYHEAHSDSQEDDLRRYTLKRRLLIHRLAKQVQQRWDHFAEGGEPHDAPTVERPVPPPADVLHGVRKPRWHELSETVHAEKISESKRLADERRQRIEQRKRAGHNEQEALAEEESQPIYHTIDPLKKTGPMHTEVTTEKVTPHTSAKKVTSGKHRYEADQRRRIRKHLQGLSPEQRLDFHHKQDPSRCFAAAARFCPGLQYAFAEFIACALVNETLFKDRDAHCRVDLVEFYRGCAPDLLTYCPDMASHEAMQCLADVGDKHARLVKAGGASSLPLTDACFRSELLEIARQSEHIAHPDRPVTEDEKKVIQDHQERFLVRPSKNRRASAAISGGGTKSDGDEEEPTARSTDDDFDDGASTTTTEVSSLGNLAESPEDDAIAHLDQLAAEALRSADDAFASSDADIMNADDEEADGGIRTDGDVAAPTQPKRQRASLARDDL